MLERFKNVKIKKVTRPRHMIKEELDSITHDDAPSYNPSIGSELNVTTTHTTMVDAISSNARGDCV